MYIDNGYWFFFLEKKSWYEFMIPYGSFSAPLVLALRLESMLVTSTINLWKGWGKNVFFFGL